MAFLKTVTTSHGFEAVDAYHRVEQVQLLGKTRISFRVRSYKDNDDSTPFFGDESVECDYDIDGANPIKQAYEYVKRLPDFADASDV